MKSNDTLHQMKVHHKKESSSSLRYSTKHKDKDESEEEDKD